MLSQTIRQQITVQWDFPVIFTHHLFDPSNPVLKGTMDRLCEGRRHRAMVFIDSHVSARDPELVGRIQNYFEANSTEIELVDEPRIVPGGEAIKKHNTKSKGVDVDVDADVDRTPNGVDIDIDADADKK